MYRQLTLTQRLTIERLHQQGVSQSAIARQTGVHRSTIKRELDRNSQKGAYTAEEAQSVALYRKRMAGTIAEFKQFQKRPGYRGYASFPASGKSQSPKKHLRYKRRRRQLRPKRWQFYIRRRDLRPYQQHANKRRPWFYARWKSSFESRFRFRDNSKAELSRSPRTRRDFLLYFSFPTPPSMRLIMKIKRSMRKFRRRVHEEKACQIRREMIAFERRLMEKNRDTIMDPLPEEDHPEQTQPRLPFFFFIRTVRQVPPVFIWKARPPT